MADVIRDLAPDSLVRQEDYGVFLHVVPRSALLQAQNAGTLRQRQRVITPDLTYRMGPGEALQVAEAKVLSHSATYYPPRAPGAAEVQHGVAKRAAQVQREYKSKARALDVRFGLRPPGADDSHPPGPLERKVSEVAPIRALVAGAFAEGSKDLHDLVAEVGKTGALGLACRLGMRPDHAAAHIRRVAYQRIGAVMAAGHAATILARMHHIGTLHSLNARPARYARALSVLGPLPASRRGPTPAADAPDDALSRGMGVLALGRSTRTGFAVASRG